MRVCAFFEPNQKQYSDEDIQQSWDITWLHTLPDGSIEEVDGQTFDEIFPKPKTDGYSSIEEKKLAIKNYRSQYRLQGYRRKPEPDMPLSQEVQQKDKELFAKMAQQEAERKEMEEKNARQIEEFFNSKQDMFKQKGKDHVFVGIDEYGDECYTLSQQKNYHAVDYNVGGQKFTLIEPTNIESDHL